MFCKKSSILTVDDDQVVSDLLYDEPTDCGYLHIEAFNGNGALAKLARYQATWNVQYRSVEKYTSKSLHYPSYYDNSCR